MDSHDDWLDDDEQFEDPLDGLSEEEFSAGVHMLVHRPGAFDELPFDKQIDILRMAIARLPQLVTH